MPRGLIIAIFAVIGLIIFGAASWHWLTRNPDNLSLRELGQNAGEAYVYGYPLVLMDETQSATVSAYAGGAQNRLGHLRNPPDHTSRRVVRPNLDTLYSLAWLDLSEGPVVLRWPDMGDRYWLFQILDGWTDVAGQPGSRLYGTGAGTVMIAGPDWYGPALPDSDIIRVETEMAWVLGRIAFSDDEADKAAVHALQNGFALSVGANPAAINAPVSDIRPPDVVAGLAADEFFTRLAALMVANPPRPGDAGMVQRLSSIGVGDGVYDASGFGPLAKTAINKGVETARSLMTYAVLNREAGANGWIVPSAELGDYGTDYNLRAGVSLIGLGANKPEDALYPLAVSDMNGDALNGAHTYRLRFEAGQIPPADAFWSITSYDGEGWLMDVPRYNLGDRDALVLGEDGSLTITIGASLPDDAHEANHLPVVDGEAFQLTARLYDPRAEALSGEWQMPAIERLD
jgi:hypothetical protein